MTQRHFIAIALYCIWSLSTLASAWSVPRLKAASYSRQYTHWRPDSDQIDIKALSTGQSAASRYRRSEYSYKEAFENNGLRRAPWMAPPLFWKLSYRLLLRVLPFLYALENRSKGEKSTSKMIPNSSLSLPILWWKALMKHPNSEAASWAYDLLPSKTRWIFIKLFGRFFPALHHVNIELRTTFLDGRVTSIVEAVRSQSSNKRIRLVVLGAGYDLRATRFLSDSIVDEAIELDLPEVIQAKKEILESETFQKRRPGSKVPKMAGVDLNDMVETKATLSSLFNSSDNGSDETFTIFLLEGILVHLKRESTSKVLKLLNSFCSDKDEGYRYSLVFCDYIEGVKDRNLDLAKDVLYKHGWELKEFVATPTKTPHFGLAVPSPKTTR